MEPEQFSLDLDVPIDESKLDPNPMVQAFGFGPSSKCKECKNLFVKKYAGKYLVCVKN